MDFMKRKLSALLLALSLAAALTTPAFATVESECALPPLVFSVHYAYLQGYDDGTIRPQGNVTRAELATIFFRVLREDIRTDNWSTKNDFSDVSEDDWYNNAVSLLCNIDALSGYADGTFQPNAPVTRAEMAALAAKLNMRYGYNDQLLFPPFIAFTDIDGHWAQEYIRIAAYVSWVEGYEDSTYRPDALITRAETAAMINRLLGCAVESADDLLPDILTWSDNTPNSWYYFEILQATNSHEYRGKETRVPGRFFHYEYWVMLLPNKDWSALERPWSGPYLPH